MRLALVFISFLFVITSGGGAEALHERVDALIAAKTGRETFSAAANDAEFLRRVWLDFDGGIPSATEARAFLDDKSAGKREAIIAKLIAAPRFATRMADAFNVMLMERRGDNAEWRAWLVESFKSNKPWDAMVREMLAPDFLSEQQRGAGYFITRRLEKVGQQDTDYPGLTRDVGRMFLGVDLQCCQCHRHLSVDDYAQQDFSGLFTVYQNLKLQPADAKHKTAWVSEGLIPARYEFASVLTGKKKDTAPRVPFGKEITVPALAGDDAWLVKPDRKTKEIGTPKFSALREIAQQLPSPEHALFAKNIANRMWWMMTGRGLVEPLDLHHSKNPATHPELLDLLAKEFTAHHFDLRWLITELARTAVYARSSALPEGVTRQPEELCLTARERHLTCDQKLRAFLTATGELQRVTANAKPDVKDDAKKYSLADFEKAFASAFANPPKEAELRVNPSLRSALLLRNGDLIHWALQPRAGNLIERVSKLTSTDVMADDLYLSILTRLPDAEEKRVLAAWIEKRASNKSTALADFAWALLSSTEFFVNH